MELELPLAKDFWSKINISEPLGSGAFDSSIKKRDLGVKTSTSPVSTLNGCRSPQADGPPLKTRRAVPEIYVAVALLLLCLSFDLSLVILS